MSSFLDDKGLNKFFQAIKVKFDTRYLNGPANSLIEQNKKSFLKVWHGTADEFEQVETKESDMAYLVEGESADAEYAPITHAARHNKDGADPIMPTSIGAVSYYAAQSLTEAQKTQARTNINAAPGGFGLGDIDPSRAYDNTNGDNLNATGWYVIVPEIAGFRFGYSLVRHESYDYAYAFQTLYLLKATTGWGKNCVLRRVKELSTWDSWEWVNPPMMLGVEYRTTERYLGNPVYVKAVNFGALPNNTTKNVSLGIDNPEYLVGIWGNSSKNINIPSNNFGGGIGAGNIVAIWTNLIDVYISTDGDRSAQSAIVTVKYTKTTD